ncbi:hypothetical protein [Marinobacter confluentis]|uniref:Uncharacterized protein n=1 Tax=Marinobacter confluentis TaxID=1697557 RepID=A0A4Z1BCK4_9GAMM|nr:hypothetical protein [Marinobacter confluentis]TGN39934.1 hypothetical protein E5Q11_06440 [Marinobacter confluentis]
MAKILVYELNEVPWRVVDLYLQHRPEAFLHSFMKNASCLTTRTVDSGELHPWSTWPTMHRGVSNDKHEIRYINQDRSCGEASPPVWELVAASGKTVGVCGSLQSYPPMENPEALFHVPDTFAPGSETRPDRYAAFQRVNLKLTGENKAVAKGYGLKDLLDGVQLFRSGVSVKTGFRLSQHLVRERVDPKNKALRATMQAHVAFDVFLDALKQSKPNYAAVFSNHVAGMMHRYWKYSFPEDFNYSLKDSEFDRFHSQSILKAMDIFDEQLGVLEQFADREGYEIVVSSSMGQEAVERGEYVPELKLDDESLLASAFGFQGAFRMNLAMQPDVALEFLSQQKLLEFVQSLPRLTDAEGQQVLIKRYNEQGLTLNLSVRRSKAAVESGTLYLDEKPVRLDELGFSVIERDPGTGYHQPEGIWLWKGAAQPKLSGREVVDSRQYAPTILRALGVSCPDYMMAPVN